MRNGNDDEAFKYAVETIGSYRTYEEWKLFPVPSDFSRSNSSYRTYEEWKHSSKDFNFGPLFVSSYRTYEEWKHNRQLIVNECLHRFLPYLWGMETVCGM